MALNKTQIEELIIVVKQWLKEKEISHDGVIINIKVIPVHVAIQSGDNTHNRGGNRRKAQIVPLSKGDWDTIFEVTAKDRDIDKLRLLMERDNAGLV